MDEQVHADASTFAEGVSKEEALKQVLDQAEGLFDGQRNWVANLANTASLLWHAYKSLSSPSRDVNWAGFYVVDPSSSPSHPSLILGPFMGKVACQTIAFGKGVCGTAAATQQTQLVPNVDDFPGHIACDGASKSEIVVPITVEVLSPTEGDVERKVVAIIDIDCAEARGFDETDKKFLEELAELLGTSCDW
ncbi:Free methionine-R-sulfoxide reductase [Cytospora mali]|uniref:Free methionine-R-sulfoxide reductase n=1 Tax=Cytospora mali TaxID=578113 RepID=A0A194VAN5_CYTMA|nr:Free methionine-R-sulfoxide reductase [Valsa mali var. pyri (nom. inval.)]